MSTLKKPGRYRLVEGDNEITIDVPITLSLMQTVLDEEYAQLDLNIDEVILDRQEKYEKEQQKYVELPDEIDSLRAFNSDIKVFLNFFEPVFQGYKEIDRDQYYDKRNYDYYAFYCLRKEKMGLQ